MLKDRLQEDINVGLSFVHKLEFKRLPPCKDGDLELRETVKSIRNIVKNDIKRLKELWFYDTIETYQEDHAKIADAVNQLVILVNKLNPSIKIKRKIEMY